jgi:hypothetical protein
MPFFDDYDSMDFEYIRKFAFETIDNYYNTLMQIPIKQILVNPDYFAKIYLDINYNLSELIIELANESIPLTVEYLQKINIIQELTYLLKQKVLNEYKDISKHELKKILTYVKQTVKDKINEYEKNIDLN